MRRFQRSLQIPTGCHRCGKPFTTDMVGALIECLGFPDWIAMQYHRKCIPPRLFHRYRQPDVLESSLACVLPQS